MRRFVARLLRRLADRLQGCVRNRHPGGVAACNCLAPPSKRGHGSDTTIPSAHVPPPRDSGATHRQHYAGYVGPDVTPSESGVAVTFTDSLPRRDPWRFTRR